MSKVSILFLISGGYFHGVNSLTFGVDIEKIRWFGILQVSHFIRFLFIFSCLVHFYVFQ